jgi:hypothetical protein
MEGKGRFRNLWPGVYVIILQTLLMKSLVLAHFLDCDPVNQARYCLCAHGERGVWDIQCPARILEVYPITLKRKTRLYVLGYKSVYHIINPHAI